MAKDEFIGYHKLLEAYIFVRPQTFHVDHLYNLSRETLQNAFAADLVVALSGYKAIRKIISQHSSHARAVVTFYVPCIQTVTNSYCLAFQYDEAVKKIVKHEQTEHADGCELPEA